MLSAADLISSGVAPPSVVGAGMFMWSFVVGVHVVVVGVVMSVCGWVEMVANVVDGGAKPWMEVEERASESIAAVTAFLFDWARPVTAEGFAIVSFVSGVSIELNSNNCA